MIFRLNNVSFNVSLVIEVQIFLNLFVQCGYSSPTQAAITKDLGLTVSEVIGPFVFRIVWF